jgi:hypothetical protein
MAAGAAGAAGARFDNAALPAPDAKDLEKVDPLDFEPMQIPVGMREVERKEKDLRALGDKDRKKWLQERAVPYVKRQGKRRPIDHHHETRAAWQAGMDRVYAYSAVTKEDQKRLDAMSDEEFWAEMKRRGWFYDKDQFGGGPRGPHQLPEDTRGHADDPFRSVAGEVRRRGGYEKTSMPFAEFEWANFFRTRVKTYPRGDEGYEQAVQEALALARSEEAAGLPGYKGSGAR